MKRNFGYVFYVVAFPLVAFLWIKIDSESFDILRMLGVAFIMISLLDGVGAIFGWYKELKNKH